MKIAVGKVEPFMGDVLQVNIQGDKFEYIWLYSGIGKTVRTAPISILTENFTVIDNITKLERIVYGILDDL